MQKKFKSNKKNVLLLLLYTLLILCTTQALAQVSTTAQLANDNPQVIDIDTYSRYVSITDNFELQNFTICIGEENRTIHIRARVTDNNSNIDVIPGGNATIRIVLMENGVDTNIPEFGASFQSLNQETNISSTEQSFIFNTSLSNNGTKALHKIMINATDTIGGENVGYAYFTLMDTNCQIVEENTNLTENVSQSISANFTQINITTGANVSGRIAINEHNESPVDENVQEAVNKYVTIDIVEPIQENTISLSITFSYSDLDISEKDLIESSIKLYEWTGSAWSEIDSAVDTTANTVTFSFTGNNLSQSAVNIGTFSIRGDITPSESVESSSNSNGPSSSGGSPVRRIVDNIVDEANRQIGFEENALGQPEANDPNAQEAQNTNTNQNQEEIETEQLGMESPRSPWGSRGGNITQFGGSAMGSLEYTLQGYDLCGLLLILLIIVTIAWIVTLFLYIRERKKNEEYEKDEDDEEPVDLEVVDEE